MQLAWETSRQRSCFPTPRKDGPRRKTTLSERNASFYYFSSIFMNHKCELFRQAQTISEYNIVALNSTFYIFGGRQTNTIAAFETIEKEWKKIGEFKHAQFGHGVIIHEEAFIVVGGLSWTEEQEIVGRETQRCIWIGDTINCTDVDPLIDSYGIFPKIIKSDSYYCQL